MRPPDTTRRTETKKSLMAAALTLGAMSFPPSGMPEEKANATNTSPLEQGKELAVTYCQACHYFEGTDQAGTVGPPLVAMKPRFPDRGKLASMIEDPQVVSKPHTMMPPFGRNGLLDDHQIELIVDYLYTL